MTWTVGDRVRVARLTALPVKASDARVGMVGTVIAIEGSKDDAIPVFVRVDGGHEWYFAEDELEAATHG